MDLPNQPPSNAPAPPLSEAARKSQRSYRAIWTVGAISLVLLLAGFFCAPLVLRVSKNTELTQAVNNAREIHKALIEFDEEHGAFPNASTIPKVISSGSTPLASSLGAKSSNDYFRQLLAEGLGNERMFYPGYGPKPDDNWKAGPALEKGECGFAYIVGLDSSVNPSSILAVAPLIPGTLRFDPKPFHGMAVILRVDGSATSSRITPSGEVISQGKNILDPSHPVCGNPFTIAYPE